MKLSSLQNPNVKEAVKLQNRSKRDETGLFLIEGYRELSRALLGNVLIEKVFFCPELFLGENESKLLDQIRDRGAQLICCTQSVFKKLSYRDRPDGLIAVAAQMKYRFEDLKLKTCPLLVVAEAIEKPGNLGSILRSSDGIGADGLIVCDRCTDIYNPNVVRASVGTLFTLPVIETKGKQALYWLKKNNIQIVATSPSAKKNYTDISFEGPIAVVVGTEQYGLSKTWLENADHLVSIPMKGVADSLNVATATTLLLYEALRQRRGFEAVL